MSPENQGVFQLLKEIISGLLCHSSTASIWSSFAHHICLVGTEKHKLKSKVVTEDNKDKYWNMGIYEVLNGKISVCLDSSRV